jgi:C1A family cysteine protease
VPRVAGREWPVVTIWRKWRGGNGGARVDRAPGLEPLEPRLLLNGDLSGSDSLFLLSDAGANSAILVDLDQQADPAQEVTPLVSFEATSSGTGTDDSTQVEPTKSPDTNTQAFADVNVQPSTAPAVASLPSLGQPASYDLRTYGYVTPVQNQGNAGSCWAFGTYGSLESNILVDGGPATDLSENHLKNYHGFDWGPTEGGNYYMSAAYLGRWDGPVSEANDPYHDTDDRPSPGGPPQYYVREMLEFDTDTELKDALMTYGAIGTVMYINTAYYNATTHTYYYTGTAAPNHAVTIVGWDDNKVVPTAPAAGAWLIKNSWGADWGEGGYFWLSYYDRQGANDGVCFTDAVAPSTYEKVYYWDNFGYVGSWSTSYAFNAFTASSEQDLRAVQFWALADNAGYEVGVYSTFANGQLTGVYTSTSGATTFAGLHTVNLPTPVHLTAGTTFYIYLHIINGGTYPLAADWRVSGYSSSCTGGWGQSYYSLNAGASWQDLAGIDPTSNFCIRGLVTTTTPPEIAVLGNGIAISDGDMAPAAADGTNFGTAPLGGTGVSRTFTVRNDGTGNLVLGAVTVPTGFTVTEGLSSSLVPGASDTFTVRLDTAVGGTKSGLIFIQNDDRDEHPYNFAITGQVVGPDIRVMGNGVSIADGDTTPSTADGTDLGIVEPGGTPVSRTFTVYNDGNATLTLGTVTVPAGFTLSEGLPSSLAPGSSDTFTVRLDVTTPGTKAGDISIATNDSNENPFNFRITGTVTTAATNLALGKTAVASTIYPGLPVSNATDGNLSSRWSSQFSDSQWLYVDLGAVYTIHQVVLRWEVAYGRGYQIQVSDDASTWSDVYSTTTGDGGVEEITLALSVSGRYVRLLGTERATQWGYSLWEFEVYG